MALTVYSKPRCPQCDATKNMLKAAGIEYTEIDITQDDDAFMHVTQDLGYRQMPVVEAGQDQHWSGHDEVMLSALIAADGE